MLNHQRLRTLMGILFLIFWMTPGILWAQKKDSNKEHSDALLLKKMDSVNQADSMLRARMLMEIESLKGSAAEKKRQELVQKIKDLERADSVRKERRQIQLQVLKSTAAGAPVAPFGDTLFYVHTRIGSFSASDRATAIAEKVEKLYNDPQFVPDSLRINFSDLYPEIGYQDVTVMSINELEAMWFERKPEGLANEYLTIIREAIRTERAEHNLRNILLRLASIFLILAGIYAIVILVNKLFRRITKKILTLKGTYFKGIRFNDYQVLDGRRALQLVLFVTNAVRLLIIIVAFYVSLPLLFSVFPWSRGMAETLIGWTMAPLKNASMGLVNYLPNLFTIFIIILITHYAIKVLNFVASEIENHALTIPGFYPDWAKPTFNIAKFLLYAFSFIIIFPYLPGSDSPIFQGVSVFLGILFSLGSSSAISNAVAGLVITYMRPFKVGDRVKIGELFGDVIEKSLLVTRIRTIKNENITVPNSAILSGHTVNYTTSAEETGLILHTSVTIGYDASWKKVHELLISAAQHTKGILNTESNKPFVLQTSLDDFYVSYQINAYTTEEKRMATIYSELHENIQDKFNEAGVEILSPHYRSARDGNMTTVPSSYLPSDYQSPVFNVRVKDGKDSGK